MTIAGFDSIDTADDIENVVISEISGIPLASHFKMSIPLLSLREYSLS
jgi:hypothetical protein